MTISELNTAIKKPVDLNEWVYTVLKQRILNNMYLPDTQLRIEDLATELRVSRTPIREALLRLKMDGLVRVASRVGFFVNGITKKGLLELFELRRLIECYAAEKAAVLLSDEQLTELFKIHEKSRKSVDDKDYMQFNEYETIIHDTIISCLDNERITNTLESVRDNIYRQRMLAIEDVYNVEQSVIEHGKLLEALKSREPELAHSMMEKHIHSVGDRIISTVNFQISDN